MTQAATKGPKAIPHDPTSGKSDPRFKAERLYDIYYVKILFRERLCGGTPRNPELIKSWIKAKTGYEDVKADELTKEAIEAMEVELTDASWNGFRCDKKHGLYLECRQLKAMFREGFTINQVFMKSRGSKQLYQHAFEIKGTVHPSRIYLGRKTADGSAENPIHVQTAQGPRSALKRLDYVEEATVEFKIWVYKTNPLEKRRISEEALIDALTLLQEDGCGADRSQGNGKFDVMEFRKEE